MLGTLTVFVLFMSVTGCRPKIIYRIPEMGEKAMPQIELPQRPELEMFSEEELAKIPLSAHGKILKNQSDWWAYADIAEAAVNGFKDYIKDIFEDYKNKKEQLEKSK